MIMDFEYGKKTNGRANYHGSLSTSLLGMKKHLVNYLNNKGINAANLGERQLCK